MMQFTAFPQTLVSRTEKLMISEYFVLLILAYSKMLS